MSYMRVIPRDLFNEADLLKCLGKLWIMTEGNPAVSFEHENDAFEIEMDETDGSICVTNVKVTIHGVEYIPRRPLNCRQPWPLYLLTEDEERIEVFTSKGVLSKEFQAFLSTVPQPVR